MKGVRLYAVPILLSAFLLFLVQPMLAKAILPWFGGVASVWIVAMLFFQGMLLLGYAYSYLVVRFLPVRVQPVCHLALLLASLLSMPINPWHFWQGSGSGDPSLQILRLLSVTVGVPYFCCLPPVRFSNRGIRTPIGSHFLTGYSPCRMQAA